jgi:hypothetical protein
VEAETAAMSTELEHGDILFVYRLRVGIREVSSLEDVQRFSFLLHPAGAARLREVVVPAKRLPDVRTPERTLALVARVADSAIYFHQELQQRTDQTKACGERAQPATRAAGEGRYAIVDHDGHGHLAYALELPPEPGDAQRALGIEREASYIVAVRNPDAPAGPVLTSPALASRLPDRLRARSGTRRFTPLDTYEWLDHEGVELMVIAAASGGTRQLDIELDTEEERIQDTDAFQALRVGRGELSTEPLRSDGLI